MLRRFFHALLIATCLSIPGVHADNQRLPTYVPALNITGTLSSVGSDTMVHIISYWVVGFKRIYPGVQTRILQAGSGTAPPALIEGSSNIAPMSRQMNAKELQAFEAKFGYRPTEIRVALDALAVYVNKNNPLQGMTLPQVDAVFSSTRKCGYDEDLRRWGQFGIEGDWKERNLSLYGRNLLSGTNAFFAEHALCKGKYKDGINMLASSHDVVLAVSGNSSGIGYSSVGYTVGGVRSLPIALKPGDPFIPAIPENVYSGRYPLTRYLYIYVNKPSKQPLPPLEKEFMKMVLSDQGQATLKNNGFLALDAKTVQEELAKLE